MARFVSLVALTVSIAVAAPQNLLAERNAHAGDSAPSLARYIPDPLVLIDGGERTLEPVIDPKNGRVGKRTQPTPPPLSIHVADARPLLPFGTPVEPDVEPRDLPPPPVITDGGKHVFEPFDGEDLEKRGVAGSRRPVRRPPKPFVPPPMGPIQIGGPHTMEEIQGRVPIGKRDVPAQTAAPTFTTFFPSPDATATPITEQGQLVTMYFATTECGPGSTQADDAEPSCTTSYVSEVTAICATSLEPLAAEPISITKCDQQVTYSSQHGYELAEASQPADDTTTPKSVQEIHTLTTYYAAIWTDVVPGVKPTAGIEVICSADNDCTTSTLNSASTNTATAETGETELRV